MTSNSGCAFMLQLRVRQRHLQVLRQLNVRLVSTRMKRHSTVDGTTQTYLLAGIVFV